MIGSVDCHTNSCAPVSPKQPIVMTLRMVEIAALRGEMCMLQRGRTVFSTTVFDIYFVWVLFSLCSLPNFRLAKPVRETDAPEANPRPYHLHDRARQTLASAAE
ncbi:hypothetical protein RC74_20475 [Falsihalocynthiibacter arcticus]|uniref:Uncharacterized protein n=1 Tax=Falsihalocynthiibacter arcticus TaxID=1579316 RepID=A0A126V4T1_9RHOB|nr:hypothetical protein RC74_20475 [Falsihalocynthiibacter arcticus]